MNKIEQVFVDCVLADLAYVGPLKPFDADGLLSLAARRLTTPLAQEIVDRFEVIAVQSDPISDYQGVVFRDRNTKEIYLANRGTESLTDTFDADMDLALGSGLATRQVAAMVNWWKRISNPSGASVVQVQASGMVFTGSTTAVATGDIASALVDSGGKVRVVGHSLGGHLTTVFATLFASQVSHSSTFNGAGVFSIGSSIGPSRWFNDLSNWFFDTDSSLSRLGQLLGVTPQVALAGAKQDNFFASKGMNLTTNDVTFNQLGMRIGLPNEESVNPVSNHFLYKLTDSLALGRAMEKLSPGFTVSKLGELLEMGGNKEASSLEEILDGLRRLLLGPSVKPTASSDDGGDWEHNVMPQTRIDYHSNLAALVDSDAFKLLSGKVRIDVGARDLASKARNDFSAMASLLSLYPVVLTDLGNSLDDVLQRAWGQTYSDWLNDKKAVAAGQPARNFSDVWLYDRQALLQSMMARNLQNIESGVMVTAAMPADTVFSDLTTQTRLEVDRTKSPPSLELIRAVTFGSEDNEVINGRSRDDHLFGEGGNDALSGGHGTDWLEGNSGDDKLDGGDGADTLLGGSGDDFLIGGMGNDALDGGVGVDTYSFAPGWGADVIRDADGRGRIEVDGLGQLIGADTKKVADNVWQTGDKRINYTLVAIDAGRNDLIITFGDRADTITIENWTSARGLGITLPTAPAPAPSAANTFAGDYSRAISSDDPTRYLFDGINYRYDGPLPNADDAIIGSSSADVMSGLGGNDALSGGAGADRIDGGDGDDLLLGGTGSDTISGGAGRDFIFGSGLGKLTMPRSTIDPQPEAKGPVFTRGFGWVTYDAGIDANGIHAYGVGGADVSTVLADDGNVINAGSGSDWVRAGSGRDTVHGDADNDDIAGLGGDDVLFGDAGNDVVAGDGISLSGYAESVDGNLHGNDIISGGAGNDTLTGQGGDDVLYGGDDDDQLFGDDTNPRFTPIANHGADYLDGGDGNDQLEGGGRSDTLIGGTGNDRLWGDSTPQQIPGQYHGADYLDGGTGDDYLEGGGAADTLLGGDGNDTLWGDSFNDGLTAADFGADFLDGGRGDDGLMGNGGGDTLLGGEGNDQADGGSGNDWLDGGAGNDTLIGGEGDDVLIGGAGADFFYGGLGDDRYVFDAADVPAAQAEVHADGAIVLTTAEVVEDEGGINTVQIAGAVRAGPQSKGGSLTLLLGDPSDHRALVLRGAFKSSIQNLELEADQGGSTTVREWAQTHVMESLTLNASAAGSRVFGGGGSDQLAAQVAGVSLEGGRGNDALTFTPWNVGGVTAIFNVGDGQDTIVGGTYATTPPPKENVARFGFGVEAALLRFTVEWSNQSWTNMVYLNYGGEGDRIKVSFDGLQSFNRFEFADGSVLSWNDVAARGILLDMSTADGWGTSGNDIITGTTKAESIFGRDGNDVIDGAGGDDTIYGGGGENAYLLGRGDGRDIVEDSGLGARAGTLRLKEGIQSGDVALRRSDDDLIVWLRDGSGQVTFVRQFVNPGIARIEFNDGTTWNAADIVSHLTTQMSDAAEKQIGTAQRDVISALGGNDTVYGRAGDDRLDGGTGNDRLEGEAGDDELIGGDGNDDLNGGDGNDTLSGGVGDDTLVGGAGSDLYLFQRGDGVDYIFDNGIDAGVDVLRIGKGVSPTDVTISTSDLVRLKIKGTGDSISFPGPDSRSSIERIEFDDGTTWSMTQWVARATRDQSTDGNDTIWGFDTTDDLLVGGAGQDRLFGRGGNDTLNGGWGIDYLDAGAGNDVLIDGYEMCGGSGDDTYVLTRSSSGAVISEYSGDGGGRDVLVLPSNITPSMVTVTRSAGSMRWGDSLNLNYLEGSVNLKDYFRWQDGTGKVEEIHFANGAVWSVDDVFAKVDPVSLANDRGNRIEGFRWNDTIDGRGGDDDIEGGLGDDVLLGGAGADTLSGSEGNDDLDGGSGKDSLYGGVGSDTYHWGVASGSDVIVESGSGADELDTVVLSPDIAPDSVSLVRDLSNLVLIVGSNTPQLRISGFFKNVNVMTGAPTDYRIERIQFGDGTIWNFSDIQARVVSGVRDAMSGTPGNDVYKVDDFGDTISEAPGAGIDTVISSVSYSLPANLENLTVTGVLNARLAGNALNNVLAGNAGDNVFNSLDDVGEISNQAGRDTLIGGAGDDTYYVNGVDGYADDDVIEQADEGRDTVFVNARSYDLPVNVEELVATYSAYSTVGPRIYRGNDLDNRLRNSSSWSVTLDGGAGADEMIGGLDDDTYIVDNVGDIVDESSPRYDQIRILWPSGDGFDTVRSSVSYALPTGVERLVLTGNDAISGTGNELNNVLDGSMNAMSNVLAGGLGDDIYQVDAGDKVVEAADQGNDTVMIARGPVGTYSLSGYANIENLSLAHDLGSSNLVGDSGNNRLTGNAFSNILEGGAGSDTMRGEAGDDILIGGAGADTLVGAGDNDLLYGDSGPTIVVVRARSSLVNFVGAQMQLWVNGVKVGQAQVDNSTYADYAFAVDFPVGADAKVDVVFTNDAWIDGQDRNLWVDTVTVGDCVMRSSDSGVVLDKGMNAAAFDGLDTIAGQDVLAWNGALRFTVPASVFPSVSDGGGNDWLDGGDGDDTLIGGAGADTLVGAGGNDLLYGDGGATNVVVRARASLANSVGAQMQLWVNGVKVGQAQVDSTTYTDYAFAVDFPVEADAKVDVVFANDDVIDGQDRNLWVDTVTVGDYVMRPSASGVVLDKGMNAAAFDGLDTIAGQDGMAWNGALRFTVPASVFATVSGGGGNDSLDGGEGDDTLVGGAGADKLVGAGGNDRLYGDGGPTIAVVRARASLVNGVGAQMQLWVNGVKVGDAQVDNSTYADYAFAVDFPIGADAKVDVVFTNDAWIDGQDRNLWVDTVTVGDYVMRSSDSGVVLDKGMNAAAFDGLETIAGQDVLPWDGALRFTVPASVFAAVSGGGGNDTLEGGSGQDVLIGGTGSDTYMFGRSSDADRIQENDGTPGNVDVLQFRSGVSVDQLWFRRLSNDLEVSVVGTSDKMTVQDWYLGSQHHVEQFKTSDGKTLLDSKVQSLVDAMAAFAPPPAGQTNVPPDYQTQLAPVLASAWQG